MKQISDIAINHIQGNQKIMGLLMAHFNRSQDTIKNMLVAKDKRLIEPEPLQIIKRESGLYESQILEDISENKVIKEQQR